MSQAKQGKPTTPSKQESPQDASGPSVDNTIKEMLAQLQQSIRLQQELSERLEREREERIKQEVESRRRSLDSEQQLRDLASTISAVHEETTDRIEEIRALTFMDKHEKDPLPGLSARRSSLDPRVPKVTVEHGDYGVSRGSEESDLGRPALTHVAPAVHVMHVKEKVDPKLLIRSGSVAGRMQLEKHWREFEIEHSQRLPKIYLVHPDLRQQLVTFDQTAGTGASANLLTMQNVHLISDTALDELWSAMIRGHRMTTRIGYNHVFSKMFKPLEASNPNWVFDSAEDYDLYMQGPLGRWVQDLYEAWYFVSLKATLTETKTWPPLGWCDPEDTKDIGQVQLAMLAMRQYEAPFSAYVGRAEIKRLKDVSDWKDKFLQVNRALGKKAQDIRSDKAMFIDREDKKTLERNFNASEAPRERGTHTSPPSPFTMRDLDYGGPTPRTPMIDHSRSEHFDPDRFSLSPEETTPQRLDPGARLTAPKPLPPLQEGSSRDTDSAKHGAIQSLSPYDEDGHHGSGTRDSRKSPQPCIYHFTGRCNRNCGRTHDADAMLQYRDDLVEQILPHFEQLINSPWVKPQWVIDQFSACMRKSSNEEARRIAAMQRLKAPLYPALESSQYHS